MCAGSRLAMGAAGWHESRYPENVKCTRGAAAQGKSAQQRYWLMASQLSAVATRSGGSAQQVGRPSGVACVRLCMIRNQATEFFIYMHLHLNK